MAKKLPQVFSEEDLILILEATQKQHYRLAFMVSFYQSLRVSEIANLEAKHIDKKAHIIHIKNAKGKKDRDIPIVKPLKINTNSYLYALNKLPVGVGVRALEGEFKRISMDVLNKDFTFHSLRHSGATWLLNKKKWDIRQIQRFLGHSKLQTTEIYSHVNPQDLINLEWN